MHVSKITKRSGTLRQQRKLRRFLSKLLSQPSRCLQQRRRIPKFRRLQHRSGSFDAFEPALRIGQRPESELAPCSQPLSRFPDQRKRRLQRSAIHPWLKRAHRAPPRRTRRPQPQQFPQLVEFENVLCRS